ncbi:MAG: HNH endonuclease [Chloroflexi bacterium]|nr:HNH endonuclease [Chloroflexota bacterium]
MAPPAGRPHDTTVPHTDGEPFLEVHHIRRLSDGGPDDPLSLAGVCPNCHRQADHGDASEEFNRSLADGVASREVELAHAGEGSSGTHQALGGDAASCRWRPPLVQSRFADVLWEAAIFSVYLIHLIRNAILLMGYRYRQTASSD